MSLSFPKLNEKQIDQLSDISKDLGMISLASVVLPAVLDKLNPLLVTLGAFITIVSWIFSLFLKRR